ncbi:MAG: head-tail adaptor protein [Schleiferiaceae bacterium]|nr:head-tail adaptor protein [Schleiferiaceae bacterium]
MKVSVGQMDRKVDLQYRSRTRLPGGSVEESWSTLSTVWAYLAQIDGERSIEGPEGRRTRTITLITRWRDLSPLAYRLKLEGEVYEVLTWHEAQLDGRFSRRRFLQIEAKHIEHS